MRLVYAVILLIGLSVGRVAGQVTVIDYTCCAQVATNMATILAQEGTQKAKAEDGEEEQKKALAYVTVIQTSVSLYKLSLSNVEFFDAESKNITEIIRLSKLIAEEIPVVLQAIQNNPKATFISYNVIADLTSELQQSANYIYSIVSNGTVRLSNQSSTDSDDLNLIDPKVRLDMANRIIVNLRRSYNILLQIRSIMYYNTTWGTIINEVFPWQKYVNLYDVSKRYADQLINGF